MAQFPLSDLLTGAKRFFVSIMAQKDDGTAEIMGIDDNGGIKTALVTELPSGTNNIGSINVDSFPADLVTGTGLKVDLQGTTLSVGAIDLSDMQNKTADFVFQNQISSPGAGNRLTVDSYKNLTIEVIGTSTSREVNFWGLMTSGTRIPLSGVNVTTLSTATLTQGNVEIWQFDITGLKNVEMEITSVSGGYVTVNGKVVA